MNLADLSFESHGRTMVVSVKGEVDFSNARTIREAIGGALSNHAHALVLDLSAVDYLDSTGIELIYRLREALHSRGQALHLVVPPGSAAGTALQLAGVEHIVTTAASAQEALEAAGASAD